MKQKLIITLILFLGIFNVINAQHCNVCYFGNRVSVIKNIDLKNTDEYEIMVDRQQKIRYNSNRFIKIDKDSLYYLYCDEDFNPNCKGARVKIKETIPENSYVFFYQKGWSNDTINISIYNKTKNLKFKTKLYKSSILCTGGALSDNYEFKTKLYKSSILCPGEVASLDNYELNLKLVKFDQISFSELEKTQSTSIKTDTLWHCPPNLDDYEDNNQFYPEGEGLYAVKKKGGKWGFIDYTGKAVIPFVYDNAWFFQGGKASVAINDKWGYINKKGEKIIPFIYDEAGVFYNNRATVSQNEKWGMIDEQGKIIIPLVYESIYNNSDDMVWVLKDDKWGAFNSQGKLVIPFSYDEVNDFSKGKARVKKDGKEFMINKKGEKIK